MEQVLVILGNLEASMSFDMLRGTTDSHNFILPEVREVIALGR